MHFIPFKRHLTQFMTLLQQQIGAQAMKGYNELPHFYTNCHCNRAKRLFNCSASSLYVCLGVYL